MRWDFAPFLVYLELRHLALLLALVALISALALRDERVESSLSRREPIIVLLGGTSRLRSRRFHSLHLSEMGYVISKTEQTFSTHTSSSLLAPAWNG